MEDKQLTPKSQMKNGIVYASIFLLSTVVGAALIYSLQPPPAPNLLLYEVTIFTSDKPIKDFAPHFQMLQKKADQEVRHQSYSSEGVRVTFGRAVSCYVTFYSTPESLAQFDLPLLDPESIFRYLKLLKFEVRGEPVRDSIRTWMKIGVDNTSASHQFELKVGEYRALELIRGDNDAQEWCYAIVTVQRAKNVSPTMVVVTPRAAPTDVSNAP